MVGTLYCGPIHSTLEALLITDSPIYETLQGRGRPRVEKRDSAVAHARPAVVRRRAEANP